MNWSRITSLDELEVAFKSSSDKPVLFFKHSTRCSISSAALSRLERKWEKVAEHKVLPFFIDLVSYRQVSNAIEAKTGVEHESPQLIVFHQGKVIYNASHNGIHYNEMLDSLDAA